MDILFITNGYPPLRWAGTETYTAGIADEFFKRGHKIQVLCIGSWDEGTSYWNGFTDDTYHSIPVRRINVNWMKSPDPSLYLYNNPVVADYLRKYLKENRPDLVHITSCETLSASVLQVVRDFKLPSVLTLTDFWFLCPRINLMKSDGNNCDGVTTPWQCLQCQLFESKAYRWPRRIFSEKSVSHLLMNVSKSPILTRQRGLRGLAGDMNNRKEFLSQAITWPDVRITASEFVRNIFVSNRVSAPIKVLPYGHNLSWLKENKGKAISRNLRIGFIGQIAESKGVHVLIQAVNSLPANYQEKISLFIYGNLEHNAGYKAALLSMAAGKENIKFCGTYPHDKTEEIFSDIDVLVVPSLWYDFPLIIYEAFASKTPVVATNIGSMAEAVKHEVNGLLFTKGDSDDLAKQFMRLIDEPDLLNRLRLGIQPVKQIQTNADELEQEYLSLVKH